jgi:hypothetical protein
MRPEAGDWLAHTRRSVAARVSARGDLSADALQMSNRRVSSWAPACLPTTGPATALLPVPTPTSEGSPTKTSARVDCRFEVS